MNIIRRIHFLCLFTLLINCHASQQSTLKNWSMPIKFTLEYDSSSIKLLDTVNADSNRSRTITPIDEGDGLFTIDVIAIKDNFARIIIREDTGWIEQSRLWQNPFNQADIIGSDGATEARISLPDYEENVHISVLDSFLLIDNGDKMLRADLLSHRYLDHMDNSFFQKIQDITESFQVTPWRYCFTGDTLWALDLYRSGVWGIILSQNKIVDSVIVQKLPDTVNITGIARVNGAFYFWGLEYEYGACPLLEIAKEGGGMISIPRQLSREGGLLTKLNDREFLFFEQSGAVYCNDKMTGGLILADRPLLNPMSYSEIIYIPALDKFLGVVMNVY